MKNDCLLSLFDEKVLLPVIPSPLNYSGGKYRLLDQILPCFPGDINVFWDVFCGGGNVGINAPCNKAILNDSNPWLIDLLKTFQTFDYDYILQSVSEIIDRFDLSQSDKYGYSYYQCDSSQGLASYNKTGFLELRKEFNNCPQSDSYSSLLLFTLVVYSFNNQIRFNSRGKFNLPVGKRDFNSKMKKKLSDFVVRIQSDDYQFQCGNFDDNIMSQLESDDFVYADPPYLITCATYNEQNAWNEYDERRLLQFLDELNARGFRFALSNVLQNRGKNNTILAEWLSKNQNYYKTIHLSYNYSNCNYQIKDKSGSTDEILVVNYSI